MALVSLPATIVWPGYCPKIGGNVSTLLNTLDAAGEYQATVFQAREAMTISHVGFSTGSATGSPTADLRIETVDATTGLPSGTLWGTNTNIVTGTLTANTRELHALTAAASIAAGDVFAVKIAYASGTSFQARRWSAFEAQSGLPYPVANTGTPAKALGNYSMIVLGSSSTTFYPMVGHTPVFAIANSSFDNTDAARRGVRFQVPFPCRAVGMTNFFRNIIGNFNAILMTDAGAELGSSSTAFDADNYLSGTGSWAYLFFDNPVTLAMGTWYRAVIEPSAAVNSNIVVMSMSAAAYRTALPSGSNFHFTTFTTSGGWDDTSVDVPIMDILIDQVDDGVAGRLPRANSMIGV